MGGVLLGLPVARGAANQRSQKNWIGHCEEHGRDSQIGNKRNAEVR